MTEIVGWLALVVSLVGHTLAARGNRRGWALRLVAGCLWLWFGIARGTPQYVVTSLAYLLIDLYGWRKRAKLAKGAPAL